MEDDDGASSCGLPGPEVEGVGWVGFVVAEVGLEAEEASNWSRTSGHVRKDH